MKPWIDPKPISEAPKDRPILAWCNHEIETTEPMTVYAAHAQSVNRVDSGWHIVEWGGACYDVPIGFVDAEASLEDLPDWWFLRGSDFMIVANPICYYDLPEDVT